MPRSTGWFEYSPSSRNLHRAAPSSRAWAQLRTGGFRQVELNVAGWTAVLSPGAVVGLVGGIGFDRSLLLAVPAGAICSWFVAISVDRWRWSRSECGYELSDLSREATNDLTARLEQCGIQFRLAVETFEPDQPAQVLYCQMRYRQHVEAALDAAGAT